MQTGEHPEHKLRTGKTYETKDYQKRVYTRKNTMAKTELDAKKDLTALSEAEAKAECEKWRALAIEQDNSLRNLLTENQVIKTIQTQLKRLNIVANH